MKLISALLTPLLVLGLFGCCTPQDKEIYTDCSRTEAIKCFSERYPSGHYVYFDVNSCKLHDKYSPALCALAESIRTSQDDGANLCIKIFGSASTDGPVQYNHGLALKRAAAVKNWLMTKGCIPAQCIMTDVDTATSMDPKCNRSARIEITTSIPAC